MTLARLDGVSAPASGDPTGLDPVPDAFRAAVAETLEGFVDGQQSALAQLGPDLDPLFDAVRLAVGGGKRLRAAFVYWGWRAAGGSRTRTDALLRVAAAVELVHASALVHDDVIDASATRRGGPSAHQAFAALRGPERAPDAVAGTAARFGSAAAILLGDLLLAWSDELFTESGFKPKAVIRGRTAFDLLRKEVVAGQYLDVLAQTRRRSSAADAMRVLLYKSAKYTVERPLQLGAALGKGDQSLLRSLSSYGVPVGEAFQLRDDLLGVFGESAVTGKPSGDDIREGKRTLLIARALDEADDRQRAVLDAALGNAALSGEAIAQVQQILVDTGAVTAVETVIGELTAAALVALQHAPINDPEARTALHTLSYRATLRSA
jgi:geranylgeranyl diphosphate synthase, type I